MRQNSPLRNDFFCFFPQPSSWPVREVRFAPLNFNRGLKTRISSDDRRAIKNDHLQCEKLKNRPFCALKCGPLKKKSSIFFRPSSRPVRASRFAPPNFDRGLKTKISSDDRRAVENDHLQYEKLKNWPFCTLIFGPLKKNFEFFFSPIFSARPS